ncbi:MAG TPA: SDR family NAD(P)-dependent oxidoreductase, partial [Clostridiales bacterium]|nr:SDR family NAD(P)-dependent oxidoreductase [Clostridiales bacterium]
MGKKKLAVVTGASRGIGNAIAVTLAKEGYNIVTIGKSPYKNAFEGLEKIKKVGAKIFYVEGSLSEKKARKALVENASEIGQIDLLVNNAGMAPRVREDFLMMKEESLREVLDTNLIGTFLLTQSIANLMK